MNIITDPSLPSFSLHSSSANLFFTTISPLSSLSSSSSNLTVSSEPQCYVPETLEMVPLVSVQYFLIGLYSCTSIVALLGNLTVILVSTLGSESAPTIRLCLVNLAISDIILAVVCVPFSFTDFLFGQWVSLDQSFDYLIYFSTKKRLTKKTKYFFRFFHTGCVLLPSLSSYSVSLSQV